MTKDKTKDICSNAVYTKGKVITKYLKTASMRFNGELYILTRQKAMYKISSARRFWVAFLPPDDVMTTRSSQSRSLWEELGECSRPALLVAGSLDSKFVEIAQQMCERAGQQSPPKARRSKKTSQAQKKEMWESEEFRLPYEFMKEFPEVNMLIPDIEGLPKDEGFAAFFAQEMKKLQLEDNLALEMDDWPPNDGNDLQQWENGNLKSREDRFQLAEVEDCGHAVHIENPWVLVRLLRVFLQKLERP